MKGKRALSRAVKRSEKFYGLRARRARAVDIAWPKALARIGHCSQLNYLSDKFDGKLREYFHKFKKPPEVFVADKPQPDGSELIILKGKFKIKSVGITG